MNVAHSSHLKMRILAVTFIFGLALASPQRGEGGPGRGPPEGKGPKHHVEQVERLCDYTCESGELWVKPLEDDEECVFEAGDELPGRHDARPPRPPRCTGSETVEVLLSPVGRVLS